MHNAGCTPGRSLRPSGHGEVGAAVFHPVRCRHSGIRYGRPWPGHAIGQGALRGFTDRPTCPTCGTVKFMGTTLYGLPRIGGLLLIGAPVLWFLGWAAQRGWGHLGPGPAWTAAHVLCVLAFGCFAGAATELYRRTTPRPRMVRLLAVAMSLTGAAALAIQMVIDITAGWRAADRAAMSARYDQIFEVPGVQFAFFQVGPVLLLAGILLQLAVLAAQRRQGWSSVAYMLAGIACAQIGRGVDGLRLVEGLLALFVLVAVLPYARRPVGRRRPALVGMINRPSS